MTWKLIAFDDDLQDHKATTGYIPEDYGAVGDGTTDDTTAIQDCIDAAELAGTAVIINTIYKVTDQLDIPPGLSVIGKHRDSCGFTISSSDFNLSADGVLSLEVGSKYGPRVENIQITTDMDTTETTRSNLTAFPPLIDATACPRFFLNNIRLNRAMVGIDATGNSGGAHITNCEIGAYECGLKMNGALDFMFIDNVEFWPFGIADTDSADIYADGTNLAIDATDVDGLTIGSVGTFWCGIKLDGCFGTIGTLSLDGNYSWLKCLGTNRVQELGIGTVYKTSAEDDDLFIDISGTYKTMLSIGSAWAKQTVDLSTSDAMITCSQASSVLSIASLTANIIGNTTRLAKITAGHMILSNTEIQVSNTVVRTQSLIYASAAEIQINSLKASSITGSGVLIETTQDLRHCLFNIVAPGWTMTVPANCKLLQIDHVNTDTELSGTRVIGSIKRFYVTGTFDTSGSCVLTPPTSDHTDIISVNAWADIDTTYKQGINPGAIFPGNTGIAVNTGITDYSTFECQAYVEVFIAE
jgi:hypothetical protein